MVKLYFVRHGKTEWNLEGRFQGSQADSPLLPETLKDLEYLGDFLAPVPFDHIFSSDLPRAVKTAQAIHDKQKEPGHLSFTSELREWHLGKLEGTKVSLMQSLYPSQHHAFRNNLAQFNADIFGAETVYQATSRFINLIKAQKDLQAENLLFVSHGAIATASIRALLGYERALLRKAGGLKNSSVTILETDDFEQFRLVSWNDTSFLPQWMQEKTPLKPEVVESSITHFS